MPYGPAPGGRVFFGFTSLNPGAGITAGRTLVSGTGTGSRVAWVVRVPKTGNVVGFRMGLSTCTAPQDVIASFQDVTAGSNFPDNTEDAYSTVPLASFVANTIFQPPIMTSTGLPGGTPKAVVAGAPLGICMRWASGSGGTLITFQCRTDGSDPVLNCFMGYNTRWGGSGNWFGSDVTAPSVSLVYDDGSVVPVYGIRRAWAASSTISVTPAGSPDEYGVMWTPRVGGTLDTIGCWFGTEGSAPAREWSIYDAASTLVARVSTPVIDRGGPNIPITAMFQDVPITGGALYRFTVRPTSNTMVITYQDFDATELLHGPLGPDGVMTHRTNDGAWSQTTNRLPNMFLGFSALEY